MNKLSLTLAALLTLPVLAFAQAPGSKKKADDRVRQLCDEAELKYTVDADGDFKLINTLRDGKRTQVAWVLSATNKLGNLEIREVWSVGYASTQPITPTIMQKLLRANAQVKLGAWQLKKWGDKNVCVFSAQIAADTDKLSLLLALQAVTSTADDMEEELTGKDQY